MKKVLALALCVCMAAMLLAGCGGAGSSSAAASASGSAAAGTSASAAGALDPNIKATLTFATYDNEAMDLYEEMDLEGRFQELYPNVNIEIEEFKDDAEYFNQMKIRASAGELPDLMYLQTRYYPVFKDYMVDLSHTQAAANNTLAAEFAVDGKIIGVPEKISTDYVFYWADMFEEAGVEVPKRKAAELFRRTGPQLYGHRHGLQGQLAHVSADGVLAGKLLRQRSLLGLYGYGGRAVRRG